MKSIANIALALIGLSLAGGSGHAQDGPRRGRAAEFSKQMQGTWEITSVVRDGQPMAPDLVEALPTITFEGNDFIWGDGRTGRIVGIDGDKNPIAIDYTYNSGQKMGRVEFAIIQFDGDTLMDCMAEPGHPRPAQFVSIRGTGDTLVTYRRTSTPRGPGLILNRWFHLGVVGGLCACFIVFAVVLTVFLLWLLRAPKAGQRISLPRHPRERGDW